jgi:hypothetical protein
MHVPDKTKYHLNLYAFVVLTGGPLSQHAAGNALAWKQNRQLPDRKSNSKYTEYAFVNSQQGADDLLGGYVSDKTLD